MSILRGSFAVEMVLIISGLQGAASKIHLASSGDSSEAVCGCVCFDIIVEPCFFLSTGAVPHQLQQCCSIYAKPSLDRAC